MMSSAVGDNHIWTTYCPLDDVMEIMFCRPLPCTIHKKTAMDDHFWNYMEDAELQHLEHLTALQYLQKIQLARVNVRDDDLTTLSSWSQECAHLKMKQ